MPIPGIVASGKLGHLSTNNYTSFQTVTVGSGGASSISFSSIPSTYTHLQIRGTWRGSASGTGVETYMNFNSDSTSDYISFHQLYGDGSSAVAQYSGGSNTYIAPSYTVNTSVLANTFSAAIIDIFDYTNTNKNKVTRSLNGWDANGTGYTILRSGMWMQTSAINTITFTINATSFAQYSQIALYGVK